MFGIGWPEFIVIFLVLLIFVGPRQFPGLLQKLGHVVAQLRLASRELRNQLDPELMDMDSPRKVVQKYSREVLDDWTSPYSEAMEDVELPKLDQLDPPSQEQRPETSAPVEGPQNSEESSGANGRSDTQGVEVPAKSEGENEER